MSRTKKVLLNWYSSMKKKIEKDSDDIWHRKLTLKVKLRHFLTPPHYTISQNLINFFGYVDFYAKIFPILYSCHTQEPIQYSYIRINYGKCWIQSSFIKITSKIKILNITTPDGGKLKLDREVAKQSQTNFCSSIEMVATALW